MNSGNNLVNLRALIVDDEPMIRRLVASSLAKEGFTCDVAGDGEQALKQIDERHYDVVVTDLAMPQRSGHSLAVSLLEKPQRPLIVVLTGVLEPRIAKDLLIRGVDDIVFKPIEFGTFAAKIRSLTDRRRATSGLAPAGAPGGGRTEALPVVPTEEYEFRLRSISRIPSISEAAIEVFKIASNPDSDIRQTAAAIERDPALIVDLLRLANGSFFNPTGHKITNVDQVVTRLGQKRVGELALSTAALSAVSQDQMPFFSLPQIWRECLATGICLEMLVDQARGEVGGEGSLFCAGVMQPLGRVMLAQAFPDVYKSMLKHIERDHKSLSEVEAVVFPESTGEAIARSLAAWGIPDEIHRPLRFATLTFSAVATLTDPLRRRVELVKTAAVLGKLATGVFQTWDLIDLPPASLLQRLGVHNVEGLISQAREDLEEVASFGSDVRVKKSNAPSAAKKNPLRTIAYKRVQNEAVDLIPHLLATAGIKPVHTAADLSEVEGMIVVNALGAAVPQTVARLRNTDPNAIVILADAAETKRLQPYGRTIGLPTSYASFCRNFTPPPPGKLGLPSAAVPANLDVYVCEPKCR